MRHQEHIIPDTAEMGLTVRSYKPAVRQHLLASIERVAKAEAEAGGADKMPKVERYESTSAVYNDPILARHLGATLEGALGKSNVVVAEAGMGSEDYSVYVEQGVPSFFFRLGASDKDKLAQAKASGKALPNMHSSLFFPVLDPALHTGITAEVAILRDLLNGNAADIPKITEHKSSGN